MSFVEQYKSKLLNTIQTIPLDQLPPIGPGPVLRELLDAPPDPPPPGVPAVDPDVPISEAVPLSAKLDSTFAEVSGAQSIYDFSGNAKIIVHADFDGWQTNGTAGVNNLVDVQFEINSLQLWIPQPSHWCISNSASGTGWEN